MLQAVPPADLEERFLEPDGWRWGTFERIPGRSIRFGGAAPASPKAVIVYLEGLAEPAEKTFETAREFLAQGFSFYVMDWFGQGASGRYLDNPHKRHAGDFAQDVNDLHSFITHHVPPSSDAPLVMLAHSMGGNLGLRYLLEHEGIFKCAAFSAPLIDIKATAFLPKPLSLSIASFMNRIARRSYVMGGHDWSLSSPKNKHGRTLLSSDPVRNRLQNQWFEKNPPLQVGDATYGWVYEALRSCIFVQNNIHRIQIPILLTKAGQDILVDGKAIERAGTTMPQARFLEIEDSKHEILMEVDDIRGRFLKEFYGLIDGLTS